MKVRLCSGRFARRAVIFILSVAFLHTILFELLSSENSPAGQDDPCVSESRHDQPFPKYFHQIWTTEDIPHKWSVLQKYCRKINPQYKYMLWTHQRIDNFMQENYPWFMENYWSYPYQMQRLDAARYFILLHYGGVYVDMDMECLDTFDNIFANTTAVAPMADIVLGATEPLGVTSSFLMAKHRHGFMRYLTERLSQYNHWYITPYWTVVLGTGPLYLFRSTRSFPCREQIYIIPAEIHTKRYLDHKHASTWHSWDGPIMLWFDRHGKKILYILACSVVLLTAYIIYKFCCLQRKQRTTLRGIGIKYSSFGR